MGVIGDVFVTVVDASHRWLGGKLDCAAGLLEETAETLRWLAVLTRVST